MENNNNHHKKSIEEHVYEIAPLDELVLYLLWQQFWRPPNLVLDRSKQLQVPCSGSEKVIYYFQEILYNNFLHLIHTSNPKGFIPSIGTTCFEIELEPKPVVDDYNKRIQFAQPEARTWIIFLMQTALGSVINGITDKAYQIMTNKLRRSFHKVSTSLFKKTVTYFQETGNVIYSLTLNLQKLTLMAEITKKSIDRSVLSLFFSKLVADFQNQIDELKKNH